MIRAVALCVLPAVLLVAATASAAERPRPWATINVCDTAKHPNAVGIRASMPGTGRRAERMFVRFRVQWRDPADGLWHNLVEGGDSGFVRLGRSRGVRETGRIFRYQEPEAGSSQLLRGVVRFEWRRRGRVVDGLSRRTRAGHRSAAGSDPRGYSAATCRLR